MAQRGAWTPQKVRERIQVSMLLKRLTEHVLGRVEMSATQLKATEILLRKALPDLASVALTDPTGTGPAAVRWIRGDDE